MTLCVTLHCKKVTFVVLFNTGHCGVVLCFSLGLTEGCSRCFSQVRRRSAEWSTNQFSKVQTQKCSKEMLIVDTLSCNAPFLLCHGPVERSWSRDWRLKDSDEYNIVILVLIFPHEDNLAHWLLFCFLLLSTCNVHTSCSKLMALIAYPDIKKCSIWWVVTVAPFNLSNTCKYQELYPSASNTPGESSL